MSRILLADDSPQAQRTGERILREEGFEVVSLTDGDAAVSRMADVDPDVILADVFLPNKSGLDLCRFVKSDPRFRHVRVVLTAGLLEPFNEDQAKAAGCDGILKKPFEAARLLSTVNPLVKDAQVARTAPKDAPAEPIAVGTAAPASPLVTDVPPPAPAPAPQPTIVPGNVTVVEAAHPVPPAPAEPEPAHATPPPPPLPSRAPEIDVERIRAAVTVALDAALPAMIEEITERVLIALGH